jgi:hypothetical protein
VTVGDTTAVTALSGLPVQTTSAGVQAALVAFKSSNVWQITGDTTTNNLALNYISLTTGCVSPRSVVQGPFGVFFAGVDSPYILNFLGALGALSHTPGNDGIADLQVPFQSTTQASRIAASFSGNIYRVCVPTLVLGVAQTNDYWYDIRRKRWTGPHTFIYDCAAQFGNSFVLSSASQGAALFVSTTIPNANSVYTDAGTPITAHLKSSDFPKTGHMQQVQVVESTIEVGSAGVTENFNVTAIDTQGSTINTTFVMTPPAGAVWNAFKWGAANWSTSASIPSVVTVPWTVPLVFQKMAIDVTVTPVNQVQIGTFFARYQDAGYMNG